jgi:hypothetical protein
MQTIHQKLLNLNRSYKRNELPTPVDALFSYLFANFKCYAVGTWRSNFGASDLKREKVAPKFVDGGKEENSHGGQEQIRSDR